MLTRNINGVEFDIDINKGNEIYFDADFYEKCKSTGINDILYALYTEKKSYTPESLFLELTGRCNFNCPFCYIHNCENVNKVPYIPFERLKNDIDYLIDNGLLTCTISGGECFLHPDFNKIYRYLKERGIIVTVLSNLSLLDEEIIKLFEELPPYKVDVSIYAMEQELMEKITGNRSVSCSDILDNILTLKNKGINVTCKTPYNTVTESQIMIIETWCKQNSIPYFFSMETFESYDGQSMEHYSMPFNDVFNDKITAKKQKMNNTSSQCMKKNNFDCKGGQYGLFISYDYKLRPCMPFYCVEEANFDINKYGIEYALNKMKAFINKYKETPLAYCRGCDKHELCDLCVITQLSKDNLKQYVLEHCKLMCNVD